MSLGEFDYCYLKVDGFANDLAQRLPSMKTDLQTGKSTEFSPETLAKLTQIQHQIALTAKLMREVECVIEGDTGNASFLANVAALEAEFKVAVPQDGVTIPGAQYMRFNDTLKTPEDPLANPVEDLT